jgi:hypothetical protein
MNMLDRLLGAHYFNMHSILDKAAELDPEQLDRPLEGYFEPLPWMPPVQSLRSLLRTCCGASDDVSTIDEIRHSLREAQARLAAETAAYERDKLWDLTFVDSECNPPMVFSYGGWIGHIVTGQIYRRVACLMGLRQLGIEASFAGPNEFDDALRQGLARR